MNDFIAIRREDFDFLTEYVEDLKPSFYKAAKAVRVQEIFRTAIPLTMNQPESKPETKPDEQK